MKHVQALPPPRSYLFVPGDRPERFAKALAAGADAVIVDLEDAVAPGAKAAARQTVAANLTAARPLLVRINGPQTEWFEDDVRLCRLPGVAGIVLPKAERVDDVRYVAETVGNDAPILALIETARGVWNAEAIARGGSVDRLLFGSLDLQLDLGVAGDGEELNYFRSLLVLVSRVAGIAAPVDGVTTALNDPEQLRADARRAKRFGFAGKLCIHPQQVGVVNESFGPSAAEVEWARRVVDAAGTAAHGAVALDGNMIDRPVLARAEAILRAAFRPPADK